MLDLDRLEQLARAATPGPWTWEASERDELTGAVIYHHISSLAEPARGQGVADTYHADAVEFNDGTVHPVYGKKENAAFIAAASPATVLELVAELRRLRDAENDALDEYSKAALDARKLRAAIMAVDEWPMYGPSGDEWCAFCGGYREEGGHKPDCVRRPA